MRLHNDQTPDEIHVSIERGEMVEIVCMTEPSPATYKSLEGRRLGTITNPMGRMKWTWNSVWLSAMSAKQLVLLYNEVTQYRKRD